MPNFSGSRSDANEYRSSIKRANDRVPVTFDEDIRTRLSKGGNNDLGSILGALDAEVEDAKRDYDGFDQIVAPTVAGTAQDRTLLIATPRTEAVHVTLPSLGVQQTGYKIGVVNSGQTDDYGPVEVRTHDGTVLVRLERTELVEYTWSEVDGWKQTAQVQIADEQHLVDLDALPSLEDYEDDDIVIVEGDTYKRATTHATQTDLFEGKVSDARFHNGRSWRGAGNRDAPSGLTGLGAFSSNFDNVVALIAASSDNEIQLVVSKAAYEREKGADVQQGDSLGVSLSYPGSSATDTATLIYRDTYTARDGEYLTFWAAAGAPYDMYRVSSGRGFHLKILNPSDGTAFFTHSNNAAHWLAWEFAAEQANQDALNDLENEVVKSIDDEVARLSETIQETYELLHKTRDVKDVSSLSDLSSTADGTFENLVAKEVKSPAIPAPLSNRVAERFQGIGYERGVYEVTESDANAVTGTDAATINRNSFVMRIDKFEDALYTTYGAATHHSLLAEVDGDLGRFIHNPLSAIHAFVADNDLNFYIWIKEAVIEAWRGGAVAPNDEDVYYNVLKMQEPDGTIRTKVFAYPWHDTTQTKAVINGVTYRRMASDGGINRASNWLRTLFEANPGDSDAEKQARTVRCWLSHSSSVDGTLSLQPRNTNIGDERYPGYLGNADKAWTMRTPTDLDVDPAVAVLPPPPEVGARNDKTAIYDGNTLKWEDFAQAVRNARRKDLIGTVTSAGNTLAGRPWTIPSGHQALIKNIDRAGATNGTDWIEIPAPDYMRWDLGYGGVVVEAERAGAVRNPLTSVFIPFHAFKRPDNPWSAGMWQNSDRDDKKIDAVVEQTGSKLRLRLSVGDHDNGTTLKVYLAS